MRIPLLLMASMLLCPILACAESRPADDFQYRPWWLGVGLGGGSISSEQPAPSAGRNAFSFSFDAGLRFTPQWGLGMEYGAVTAIGGCGGHHCTSTSPDFAPDFQHWFLVAEHRGGPVEGLRLRAGAGVSSMCYSYSQRRSTAFERFLDALLFGEDETDYDDSTHWDCDSLKALGASVSVGYQWELRETHGSIGLQLRGEAANFAASSAAGTPAFRHRALTLQIQLNFR